MIFHYTCALFCRTRCKHKRMVCKSIGIAWVLSTSAKFDGMMLSKSLIFHYTCAFFQRTRFQHTCIESKIIGFLVGLTIFCKNQARAMFKKAYKTHVILMVLQVRCGPKWKLMIFQYTCDKSTSAIIRVHLPAGLAARTNVWYTQVVVFLKF